MNCTRPDGRVHHELPTPGCRSRSIGNDAFIECKLLTIIKLPSTLTEIGESAFNGCESLSEVVLNDKLEKIGLNAFATCRRLAVVKFPSISKRAKNLIDTGITEIEDKITANQYFEWRGRELSVSL